MRKIPKLEERILKSNFTPLEIRIYLFLQDHSGDDENMSKSEKVDEEKVDNEVDDIG